MFRHSDRSADKKTEGPTIPLTMMGPTCSEWTSWPLAQRHAYLRGYLEAELFYRGLMSLQWKGKFGPAMDRAIAHVDFSWPTPARTLNEEERAITAFYEDPRNQYVLFFLLVDVFSCRSLATHRRTCAKPCLTFAGRALTTRILEIEYLGGGHSHWRNWKR